MKYLLDTDWIIQLLAGDSKTIKFHKSIQQRDIAISYVTVGEIYEVAFAYSNPQAHIDSFRQFLAPFKLLTLDDQVMEKFAELRSLLRRRGEIIPDFDLLIGATTLVNNLTLLTYNTKHFKRIPDLKFYTPKI